MHTAQPLLPSPLYLLILATMLLAPLSQANNLEDDFAELELELEQSSGANHKPATADNKPAAVSEFEQWQSQQQQQYANYKQAYFKALHDYKQNILTQWQNAEISDKKNWVEYSEDLQTKRVVDFANNEIRISVLDNNLSKKQFDQLINSNLSHLLAQTPNSARKNDPVLNQAGSVSDSSDAISRNTILSELADYSSNSFSMQSAELAQHAVIQQPSSSGNAQYKTPTVITIKLPPSSVRERAKKYQSLVANNASRYQLDPTLVFAIMHTESAFNPLARSHVPAYGLMQIVPESAGRDVALRLYGKDQILSPDYLYNASNNVQAGATYIHILYYSYLKAVENPLSRLYCVIAAYNTGAGNVARAFVNKRSLQRALPIINQLSPQQVYQRLVEHLPYEETRHYLQRVVSRQQLYGESS
ncbi:transglycosylase SLT domain-containing protein [Dasania marina]|uniref:transglycosylase SLT domain-containing protein n=1 Tax=Dasania marina TaxID=471499 RepID=UPI0030DA3C4F